MPSLRESGILYAHYAGLTDSVRIMGKRSVGYAAKLKLQHNSSRALNRTTSTIGCHEKKCVSYPEPIDLLNALRNVKDLNFFQTQCFFLLMVLSFVSSFSFTSCWWSEIRFIRCKMEKPRLRSLLLTSNTSYRTSVAEILRKTWEHYECFFV